jgi:hypothetical protein
MVLADFGELVDPRGHLGGIGRACLPDQVTGLPVVASCRRSGGQVEDGGRCLGGG